jgi:hypothetical protein
MNEKHCLQKGVPDVGQEKERLQGMSENAESDCFRDMKTDRKFHAWDVYVEEQA